MNILYLSFAFGFCLCDTMENDQVRSAFSGEALNDPSVCREPMHISFLNTCSDSVRIEIGVVKKIAV